MKKPPRELYGTRKDTDRGTRRTKVESEGTKPRLQVAYTRSRDEAKVKFYKSYTWIQTSKRYRKANPLCATHKSAGMTVPCNMAHHIQPIMDGGEQIDPENLMSLCNHCHVLIHEKIEYLRRTNKLPWDRYPHDPGKVREEFLEAGWGSILLKL